MNLFKSLWYVFLIIIFVSFLYSTYISIGIIVDKILDKPYSYKVKECIDCPETWFCAAPKKWGYYECIEMTNYNRTQIIEDSMGYQNER